MTLIGGNSCPGRSISKIKNSSLQLFSPITSPPPLLPALPGKVHRIWSVKGGSWECERKEGGWVIGLEANSRFLQFLKCFPAQGSRVWEKLSLLSPSLNSFPRTRKVWSSGVLESGPRASF